MNAFNSSSLKVVCRTFAALTILLAWQGTAAAVSGTWSESTGDGPWSSGANWSGGTIADGAGNTADFSVVDLDAVSVSTTYPTFFRNAVQLDSSRTIGNLVFGDANLASGGGWEVYPNAGTEILTLEGSSPTITVNPLTPFDTGLEIIDDAVIRPVITGTNGLTKLGNGILTLNSGGSFNLLTGGINIDAGTLRINSVINGQAINIANGATLSTNQELRNVVVGPAAHTINVASGATANFIASNNVGNVAAAGATLNLSVPNAGDTFSANDNWAVNGSITRLNVSSANGGFFRLRINGGAFDGNSFANTHVDLDNITTWTRTNSGGNTVNIGALSGSASAVLSGGGQGGGTVVNYSVGALNTDTTFAGNIDWTASTDPDGSLNLAKVGTSKLTLSGTLNYVPSLNGAAGGTPDLRGGITTVSTGTLALTNSASIAGGFNDAVAGDVLTTVNVQTAGTLDVSGYTAGTYSTAAFQQLIGNGIVVGNYNHVQGFLRPGNTLTGTNPASVAGVSPLTFANDLSFAGSGEITYDMTPTPVSGNDQIQVNGTTQLAGSTTRVTPNFIGGTPSSGTYTILNSTGGFTGTPAGWTVAWPGRGAPPTVVVSGNQLQFNAVPITGGDNLNWSGAANGNWNSNNTINWHNNTDAIADKYFDGDLVTFGDTYSGGTPVTNFAVTIASAVSPGSMTVNSTNNYTISGAGSIAGTGTFTKRGSSTLTMQKANSFSGQATIEVGAVNIGNFNASLGTGQLHFTGGTLLATANGLTNSAVVITSGNNTIQSDHGTFFSMPALSGAGNLTVTSNDDNLRVDLANAVNNFTGSVTFGPDGITSTAMTVRLAGAANDLPAASVTLRNGAVLANRNGSAAVVTMELGSLAGDATTALQAFSGGGATPGTNWQIGALNASTAFAGIIRNNSATVLTALTKVGIGTLTLSGPSTYTGNTSVNAGVLSIGNPFLADVADVNLTTGAVLDLNFGVTDTIDSLFFNGVSQTAGTWGSLASAATNKSAFFTGAGLLAVTTFVAPPLLVGDYNSNGTVSAADYTIWRNALGSATALANRDPLNAGNVSVADYDSWKANFGAVLPGAGGGAGGGALAGAAGLSVPEPASWVVALVALAAGGLVRRARFVRADDHLS